MSEAKTVAEAEEALRIARRKRETARVRWNAARQDAYDAELAYKSLK